MHRRMLTRRVAKIKIHLHYNSRTNDNDIALIKLSRPVKLSGRVRTIEHEGDFPLTRWDQSACHPLPPPGERGGRLR